MGGNRWICCPVAGPWLASGLNMPLWASGLTYLHTVVDTQQRQVPPQIAGPCLFTCAAIGRGWKSRWLNGWRLTYLGVDLALNGYAGPADRGTLGAIGWHMNHRMQSAVERPMDAACLLPGAGTPYRTLLCCQAERRVSRPSFALRVFCCVCVPLCHCCVLGWAGWFNPEALDLLLSSGHPLHYGVQGQLDTVRGY